MIIAKIDFYERKYDFMEERFFAAKKKIEARRWPNSEWNLFQILAPFVEIFSILTFLDHEDLHIDQ
jgi:hypothetical protein